MSSSQQLNLLHVNLLLLIALSAVGNFRRTCSKAAGERFAYSTARVNGVAQPYFISTPQSIQPSPNNINPKTPSDRTSTIGMLCQVCGNLDLDLSDTQTGILHHASYADLVKFAEAGCELCSLIQKSTWSSHLDKQLDTQLWLFCDPYFNGCNLKQGKEPKDNLQVAWLDICTAAGKAIST